VSKNCVHQHFEIHKLSDDFYPVKITPCAVGDKFYNLDVEIDIHIFLFDLIPTAENQGFANKLFYNFDFLLASLLGHIQSVSERRFLNKLGKKECFEIQVIFAYYRHVLEKLGLELSLLNDLPQYELVKLHAEGLVLIFHNDLRYYFCRLNVSVNQIKQVRNMGFQSQLSSGRVIGIVE